LSSKIASTSKLRLAEEAGIEQTSSKAERLVLSNLYGR